MSLNRGDRHGSERSEEVESVPEDRRVLHKHNDGGESKQFGCRVLHNHNNVDDEYQNNSIAATSRTNMSLSKKMPASTSGSMS